MGTVVQLKHKDISFDAIYPGVYAEELTQKELRYCNLEKYLFSAVVKFKSSGKAYEATYFTQLAVYGPRVSLRTTVPVLEFNFGEVEQLILRLAKGAYANPVPTRLQRFREEGSIALKENPTLWDIADFVHRCEEEFTGVNLGRVFFKDVPHTDYLNSNLPFEKLTASRAIIFSQ